MASIAERGEIKREKGKESRQTSDESKRERKQTVQKEKNKLWRQNTKKTEIFKVREKRKTDMRKKEKRN